jgi:hypothetical protein
MKSKPVAAPRTNWPAAHQTDAEGVSLSESEAELLSELAAGTAWLAATVVGARTTAGDEQLTELDAKLLDQQLRLNSCGRGPSPRTVAQAACLTHPKKKLNSYPYYLGTGTFLKM